MTFKEAYDYCIFELNTFEKVTETVIFLETITGIDRKFFLKSEDSNFSEEAFVKLKTFIERRKTGEPVQYIVGKADFYGLEFYVKKGVLIPRFDTENLVEKVLSFAKEGDRVLDVCTGSGCILLSVMKNRNNIDGIGCDISDEALEVAKTNAERFSLPAVFVKSDLFDEIEGEFDIIVSNPPYIVRDVVNTLESQVKDFEPKSALDGGEDGLDFYRKIAKEAKGYLKQGGLLLFEIGFDQGKSVPEILFAEGYEKITVDKDLSGLDRVVSAVYGG